MLITDANDFKIKVDINKIIKFQKTALVNILGQCGQVCQYVERTVENLLLISIFKKKSIEFNLKSPETESFVLKHVGNLK